MQTSKRILTALLSFGMFTVAGQTALLAQTDETASTIEANASPAPDTSTTTTEAAASPSTDTTTSTAQPAASPAAETTISIPEAIAWAATGTITAPNRATVLAPDESEDLSLEFAKGEINVSPFAVYSDQAGDKWGVGVAGTYFITDKIGVGAATYWTDFGGTFFDNIEFEGYFRWPFKRVAPYAMASLGYQFDREYWFETFGGGVDFRAFKRVDAFADLQWRIANSGKSGDGALLRVGVRFNLK